MATCSISETASFNYLQKAGTTILEQSIVLLQNNQSMLGYFYFQGFVDLDHNEANRGEPLSTFINTSIPNFPFMDLPKWFGDGQTREIMWYVWAGRELIHQPGFPWYTCSSRSISFRIFYSKTGNGSPLPWMVYHHADKGDNEINFPIIVQAKFLGHQSFATIVVLSAPKLPLCTSPHQIQWHCPLSGFPRDESEIFLPVWAWRLRVCKLMMFLWFAQAMDELPDYAIPIVFSYLGVKETLKCGSVSKEWGIHGQKRLREINLQASKARAKVSEAHSMRSVEEGVSLHVKCHIFHKKKISEKMYGSDTIIPYPINETVVHAMRIT